MAGVLAAGEIIKEHYFPEHVLEGRYRNTLMGQFSVRNLSRRKVPRPGCPFCTDAAYLGQYERRWDGVANRKEVRAAPAGE